MAGSQVDKSVAIDYFQQAVLGYDAVSISEYDTTAEPQIKAGSVIEISQELYEFPLESITGWSGIADSTQAYIYFVPSGTSCTAIFSSTAPTWNDAKNGWYNGNNRALFRVYRISSTEYRSKTRFKSSGSINNMVIPIGDWDMSSTSSVNMEHGLSIGKIISANAMIINDTGSQLYSLISPISGTLDQYRGGDIVFTAALVGISRGTGSFFDSTAFNSTSYNRGFISLGFIE